MIVNIRGSTGRSVITARCKTVGTVKGTHRISYTVTAPQALPPGAVTVTLDFAYDGGGAGKGGKATLYVNGKQVAEGRVEKTSAQYFLRRRDS